MKKKYYLGILIFLTVSSMILTASAYTSEKWLTPRGYTSAGNAQDQEANQVALIPMQVTLTLYVLDGGVNGPLLPGVTVTGQDASGNSFECVTDSNGAVVIKGRPGTWRFTFAKEGYKTFNRNYDVTRKHSAATYLNRAAQFQEQVTQPQERYAQPQEQYAQPQVQVTQPQERYAQPQEQYAQPQVQVTQPQGPVALTIHVHEGDLNGTLLSGVQVTGHDAAGISFGGITDSSGSVYLGGQSGAWKFTFTKDGYDTLNLNHMVNTTEETDIYLRELPLSPNNRLQKTSSPYMEYPQQTFGFTKEGVGSDNSGIDRGSY